MLKTSVWEVYGKLPWEQGPIIWAVPWTAFVHWAKLISLSIQKELIAVWNPWKFFMHQKNQQTTEMGRSFLDLLGYYHRGSPGKCCTTSSKTVGFTAAGRWRMSETQGIWWRQHRGACWMSWIAAPWLTPTLSHCRVKDIFFGTVLVEICWSWNPL